jgi:hypothetical protein
MRVGGLLGNLQWLPLHFNGPRRRPGLESLPTWPMGRRPCGPRLSHTAEARIEGSIFKGSLVKDESESSISKSEGNVVLQLKEWKNRAR